MLLGYAQWNGGKVERVLLCILFLAINCTFAVPGSIAKKSSYAT